MAAVSSWQFVVTDLMGVTIGELTGATERSVKLPHLRLPTASFKLPMWHKHADALVEEETLLQCWRTDLFGTRKLVFNGPIVGVNEVADATTQTIAVSAAGPYSVLNRRLIGTSKAGIRFPSIAEGVQDLGLIARDIISTVNGQEFTGISLGTHTASQDGQTGLWYLKNAGEAIAELTTGLNSFEFEVTPTVPTTVGGVGGWPQIGLFNVAPLIGGVSRLDAIYEYGTPRANVSGYERAISKEGVVTRGWISVGGWPDSTTQDLLVKEDVAARAARGLYEAVVPDGGVLDDGLRQRIVDYHVSVRKQPREIILFSVAKNARPAPLTDYNIGDFVRARAYVRGTLRFDAMFRVWGVKFDIDSNGTESSELELVMP